MDLLALLQQNQRARERRAADAGLTPTVSPDVLGTAVENEPIVGSPPNAAIADPSGYMRLYEQQVAAARLRDAPGLTAWMDEDPVNARIVYDELPTVIDLERFATQVIRRETGGNASVLARDMLLTLRSIGPNLQLAFNQGGVERATNQIDERLTTMRAIDDELMSGGLVDFDTLPQADRGLYQRYVTLSPEERALERQRLVADLAWQNENQDYLRDILRGYQEQRGYLFAGRTTNLTDVRDLRGLVDYTVLTVGGAAVDVVGAFASTAAGAGAGFLVGGPGGAAAGGAAGGFLYGAGMSFNEINTELAARDAPYTTEDLNRALIFSAASGGVEVMFGPASRLGTRVLTRAGLRKAYSEVTQGVRDRVSRGYLRRIGREYVANAAEEFFQEGAQYFLERLGVEGADFRVTNETLLEAFNAAMAGFFGGGIVGGTVAIRSSIALERASRELVEAGQTVQTMQQLQAVASELKLNQRSPTKFQQLAQRLGLSNVPVFYQASDLDAHWRSQGLNPEVEIEKLGGTLADYQAALAADGRVAVTAEGLVRSGLIGESAAFLTENGSFTAPGATPKEMKQYTEVLNEVRQDIAQQTDFDTMQPERRKVYENIYSKVRAAGRSEREAEADATMATAFFETMAQRYGAESGLDLYQRFGLEIKGEAQLAREAAAQAAREVGVPDEVVAQLDEAIAQIEAGEGLTLDLEALPEGTVEALRGLGIPVADDGTISPEAAQRLREALDGILEGAAAGPMGTVLEQTMKLVDTMNREAELRRTVAELQEFAIGQSDWRDWYDRYQTMLEDMFGDDADLFRQILAATSQAASVPANVGLAVKAYEQFLSGQEFTGYLPAVIKNLNRIRDEVALSGQKIGPYGGAVTGDEGGIAIDRHLAMIMFDTKSPTAAQVELGKQTVREIAQSLGWQPREVQAALWAANIARSGKEPRSYDTYLLKKADQIRAIRTAFPPTVDDRSVDGYGIGGDADQRADEGGATLFQGDVGLGFDATETNDANTKTDVEAGGTIEAQERTVIARVEAAGGEMLEFDQLDALVSSELVPILTADDLVGMKLFPTIADRTAAAALYTGIEGAQLDMAIPLLGGPLFPLRISNWRNSVVWANRGESVTSAKEGKLKEGATHMIVMLGSQDMHASNTTVSYAYLQTFFAKMRSSTPPDTAAITAFLQGWQKDAKPGKQKTELVRRQVREFPGFDDRQALLDYTHRISFDTRKQLMKLFRTKEIAGMGGPSVQRILDETREQALTGMNWGDGVLIVELDRGAGGGSFVDLGTDGTTPHPDFPLGIRGKVVGRLETPLNWRTLYSQWVMENDDKENLRRAFEVRRPIVEVTPQLAAQLAEAAAPGVQTPLHAALVANLLSDDMRRSGVAKNAGGIGPQDYLNDVAVARDTGALSQPIRPDAKALNAAIKAGEVRLAQIGTSRIYYGLEQVDGALRLTSLINNERGTEGLGETVAVLDAMRQGMSEALAEPGTDVYHMLTAFGFTETDTPGLLRLEGGPNEQAVDDYFRGGPDGLLGRGIVEDGRVQSRDFVLANQQAAEELAAADEAAAAGSEGVAGADDLPSRARRVAEAISGLSDLGLDNLGLTRNDRDNAARVTGAARTLLQDARGSITFPSAGVDGNVSIIKLFGEADRSTFTHEMGHFFLEAFKVMANDPRAPQDMRDDWATINTWLGRDANDTSPFTTAQHEQWARGFEAYVMEGKAPSAGLRAAFSRFKRWLTRLYVEVKNLQVELSPEVTEVMDRMLATDEQIALVKAEQQISNLFAIKPDGMSQADYDAYRKAAAAADDIAHERLLTKLMRKIRVERTREYRDARKQIQTEAEQEVAARPVYALVDRLQTGDIRLDRQQLIDLFGEGALRDVSRTKLGGKRAIYTDGGADINVVAEMAGYADGTEMMLALMDAEKRNVAVELLVTDKLNQRFGEDYLEQETLREAARAEMHNDARASVLAREAKEIERQAKARGVTLRPTSLDRLRAQARDTIQSTSMRQAGNSNLYLRAERKAAMAAQRAFAAVVRILNRKGKPIQGKDANAMLRDAHRAKQQQLLNHFMYIEARKVEQALAKARRMVKRLEKAKTRKAIASPYIDRIMDMLEQYDLRPATDRSLASRNELVAFVQQMAEQDRIGEVAIPERVIQRAKRTHYSTLTVEEFTEVVDSLTNLEHLGRTKRKLLDAQKTREYVETRDEVVTALETNLKDNDPDLVAQKGERRRFSAKVALNSILSADTIINKLDGSVATVGNVWRALKEPISRGLNNVQQRQTRAREDISAVFERHYSAKEREQLRSKDLPVKAIKRTLPKSAILAIALNTGNRDNYERLTNENNAHSFTKQEVKAILEEHMDERDWRFVQDMWDYIGSFWPEIAAQERALTGVTPKPVTAISQVAPYSFVKGGYYPIRYDPRLSGQVSDIDHNEMFNNLKAGRGSKAQTRNGHTRERVSSTGQPLRLELDIIPTHINDVIYDLEMRQPVQNAWRLLNDEQIVSTFRRKGAVPELEALRLWVQDVANGDRWASGGFNAAFRHLRSGLSIAKMGFSITTLVQQPTGLLQSAVVVGKVPLAKALWRYKNNPRRNAAAVLALSSMMQERQQTFQRDILALQQAVAMDPVYGKFSRFKQLFVTAAFYMIQKSQFWFVDVPTWMAAYDTELRKNGGDEQAAASVADQIVTRAQGSGLLSDRSGFERGTLSENQRGNEVAKLMTAFGSYMMAKLNVAVQKGRATNFRSPADVLSFAVDLIFLYTLEALLAAFLTGNWPDDEEDEQTWGSLGMWMAGQTATSMMSGVPLARDAASVLQGFGGGGGAASAIEGVTQGAMGAGTLAQVVAGFEDEDKARTALRQLLNGTGILLHVPTTQLNRGISALYEEDLSIRDDFRLLDVLLGRRD